MKNTNILFALFLIFSITIDLKSQSNLLFQDKIYITDARGNMDSITIGIDTSLASHGPILDTPFDSILEIRGSVYNEVLQFEPPPQLVKNLVSKAEAPFVLNGKLEYPLAAPIQLFIWAKYLPVTLSWDRSSWDQFSLSSSFLVPHWWSQTVINWHKNTKWDDYACMAIDSEFTTSFDEISNDWKVGSSWYRPWEIEGIGIDTLQILELAPKYKYYPFNPCLSSGVDDEVAVALGLKVYPNITEDEVSIECQTAFEKIEVFNFQGQLEQSYDGNIQNLSLQSVSSGYKILRFYHTSIRPISIKVLKI